MDKNTLMELLNSGESINSISKKTGKSLTTVRYWCKKFELKSKHQQFKEVGEKEYGEHRFCPSCKENCNIEDFYQRRGKQNSSTYCKKCTSIQTIKRTQNLKKLMVEYKGGQCEKCGYNTYIGALEFHHLNPKEKDFHPSQLKKYTFDDRVKKELDKCILVCANCHREIHSKMVVPLGFEPRIED